ncbi:hypothetical protein ABIE09_000285 [Lysobacter enzymogenes]|uniref:hypothetical protein n=1 Tax=Lysobacter enzymogenes TaxID=69 RepID=UPI0033924352
MRLPATLAPWRQWLDWFDPQLASALGECLLRLHPLLGAFRLRAASGRLEPEGIDDLRQRGSYERLLLSEWALADAAPEEFDRRAAGGEHLFLSPKLVARQADALTVAVFDTGPAQLGAPRLLHVALWILLAQRAQAAKARFVWGVLGVPGELHEADSAERLRELLGARAWRFEGEDADRAAMEQRWARSLDALDPAPAERWSIGARAPGHGLGHRVGILAAQPGALSVTISAAQARRETTLALPAADTGARLLRGEFDLRARNGIAVQVRAPRADGAGRLSITQPPVLSADGATVALALAGRNAVRVYRLNDPSHPPFVMRWDPQTILLAAGMDRQKFGGILARGQALRFWSLRGFGGGHRPPQAELALPQGRWLRWVHGHRFDEPPELWLLADGVLWVWTERRSGSVASMDLSPRKAAEGVLALCDTASGFVAHLRHRDGHLEVAKTGFHGEETSRRLACPTPPLSAFLHGWSGGLPWVGVVAAEFGAAGHGGERARIWRVWRRGNGADRDFEIILPAEWKVIGADPCMEDEPALVAFNPDRTQVVRIGERERKVIYESAVRLSTGSVSDYGWTTAAVDADGRLIVLRGRDGRPTIYPGGYGDG